MNLPGKSQRRRIALILVICVSPFLFLNRCVAYIARAGCGQLEILNARRPIPEVLEDPTTTEQERTRLMHVERVREFARNHIGLEVDETYTSYSKIDRDAAAYNVTASQPLAFEAYTWWFPIVGTVPYLGFFSRAEAEERAVALEEEGWDVLVSDVPAYSTLGWFDDPLLSSQLAYSEYYLTRLVIHESAHATIWFPGDVRFNESFASFVEQEGARQFMIAHFGPGSSQIRALAEARGEHEKVNDLLRECAKKLQVVYESGISDEEKRKEKARIIVELKERLRGLANGFRYVDANRMAETDYNNAHFMSYRRYRSGTNLFSSMFLSCSEEWDCFFERIRELKSLSVEERSSLLENE